ncbi:MAG: hypothetical protein NZ941_01235 [Candidatus Caldarchaeum sp.]|nr:hypothetical protein [Candidatus Caldarchaeum sp.]MDW7977840.1 hypothetical protein [Candidatus Caldarchaeum sp.]
MKPKGGPLANVLEKTFIAAAAATAVLWLLDGRPNASIGPAQDPTFYFSILIYTVQAALLTRYFRTRTTLTNTVGYVSTGLVSSYGLYEAVFKISFPLVDPNPHRVRWFLEVDLVPFIILTTASFTYLSARQHFNPGLGNRLFIVNLAVAAASWTSWWATCFPLNVQEYERTFMPCEWGHNVLTKAATSAAYLTVLDRGKTFKPRSSTAAER